ncbi:hypothetical protein [Mycobacteroides abscessus]|uniref:hypothetical protein n=1 Tax=Mycobacteroides abscessus TaxID=36809 RepID=UPI000C257EFD|nr:hypothetical protein [Mycobacteroides abscessus]
MELVSALSPPVAALIALIAVGVNMFNTGRQIKANAREAEANRRAQLDHILRGERREILTRAAEVVHRLQDGLALFVSIHRRGQYLRLIDQEYEENQAEKASVKQQLSAIYMELTFVATTLQMIDLPDLAHKLVAHQHFVDRLARRDNINEFEMIDKAEDQANALFHEFAARLRP